MVTIGHLRYDIIADTAGFTRGITATRRELSTAKRLFAESRTPAERLGLEIDHLGQLLKKNAITTDVYNRATKQLKIQQTIAQGGIRGTVAQLSQMPAALKSAVVGFVAYRAAGVAAREIKSAFNLAMELQSTQASFTALTGSAESAVALVDQLRQYDANTTFNFADTTNAAQKLLNFGVKTEDIISTLGALGDISTGDSEKLSRLALAFGQTTSMGRLMGQEVRQMVEAGFNPLAEISRITGESMEDLQKRMSDGGIGADELANAVRTATSEGGKFFNLIDLRADSAAGKMNLLAGEWQMLKADVAEGGLPLIAGVAEGLSTGIKHIRGEETGVTRWMIDNLMGGGNSQGVLARFDRWARDQPRVIGNTPGTQTSPEAQARNEAENRRRAEERAAKQEEAAKAEAKRLAEQNKFVADAGKKNDSLIQQGLFNARDAINRELAFGDLGSVVGGVLQFKNNVLSDLAVGAAGFVSPESEADKNKPQQVEFPPSAQRASVEEFRALARISTQSPVEKKRDLQHNESQTKRTAIKTAIDQGTELLQALLDTQPEPVG